MYSVAPCDLPVSWSPSGWEPQSYCNFGRLRCHGATCKEHSWCVISHLTHHTLKKVTTWTSSTRLRMCGGRWRHNSNQNRTFDMYCPTPAFSVAGVEDRQVPDLGQPLGKAVRVARCTIWHCVTRLSRIGIVTKTAAHAPPWRMTSFIHSYKCIDDFTSCLTIK